MYNFTSLKFESPSVGQKKPKKKNRRLDRDGLCRGEDEVEKVSCCINPSAPVCSAAAVNHCARADMCWLAVCVASLDTSLRSLF